MYSARRAVSESMVFRGSRRESRPLDLETLETLPSKLNGRPDSGRPS